jgi:hypothetical protein
MKSDFNSLCFDVVPQDILGGKREETKEDAFTSMKLKSTGARARGTNPNTTTKRAHGAKIGLDTSAKNVRRAVTIFQRKGVLHAKIGVKSVRPKTSIQIGTDEHGTKSVPNGLVGTFNWTVLVRTVGTSGIDDVTKALKKGTDFLVVEKLTALVEVNIFAGHGWGILLEP